jgi:DNA-binding NtrC family response regulator
MHIPPQGPAFRRAGRGVSQLPGRPVAMLRRLLIAEDSAQTRDQLAQVLSAEPGFDVHTVADGLAARALLERNSYSLLLTDLKMPRLDGMHLIEWVRQQKLPTTVIVMTGYGSVDQAVQAMRLGATDFLSKPVDPDHLKLVLERALRERGLVDELMHLREQLNSRHTFSNMVSKSPRMHAVFELINHIAAAPTTVLINGETGTGKEQVARAIHQASSAHRPGEMVAINCAAVPETLLESELFGHEKGAFTSAVSQRRGRFEQADGGTIFLDEVGDIPAQMQVKLLRVLQERRFERVGGANSIEVDVRVIAATNRSLRRLVKAGTFREDLYYRLNVVRIDLPPLRERPEDIPLLATHFAAVYATPGRPPKPIAPEAMERLLAHDWPGNIRELENAMERASVTSRGPVIELDDLPPEVLGAQPRRWVPRVDITRPLADLVQEATVALERAYLVRVLKKTRGHVGRCARITGLSRRSISAKLTEYRIDKNEFK